MAAAMNPNNWADNVHMAVISIQLPKAAATRTKPRGRAIVRLRDPVNVWRMWTS